MRDGKLRAFLIAAMVSLLLLWAALHDISRGEQTTYVFEYAAVLAASAGLAKVRRPGLVDRSLAVAAG